MWFVIKTSCGTLPVSLCPRHLLHFFKCMYFWRGGLFYTNTPWVLLFRMLIDLLSSTLKVLYLHNLVIFKKNFKSMYFFSSHAFELYSIYLNVTLGFKCTIIHVLHNKTALYGKCVCNVCFAKTSECCNVQVSTWWTCQHIGEILNSC